MKVLVHGGTGLLGRSIMRIFEEKGFEVIGTGRSRVDESNPKLFKCDATNENEVKELIKTQKPDVLIHCVAARQPDDCENDEEMSERMNVGTAEIAAQALSEFGGWMLFLSSDYVFDGTSPPYGANSPTNPLNVYGRDKVRAEARVRHWCPDAGILRLPLLYGPSKDPSETGVLSIAKAVKESSKKTALDNTMHRYPTHTDDVARCLLGLAQRKQKHCGFFGVWHFSGDTGVTKFELAQLIGQVMNWSTDHIEQSKPSGVEEQEGGGGGGGGGEEGAKRKKKKKTASSDATTSTSTSAAAASASKKLIAARPVDCHLDCGPTKLMGLSKITNLKKGLKEVIQFCFE